MSDGERIEIDFFFFFQAEDGIRDVAVTGVQTCALPILFPRRGRNPRLDLAATLQTGRRALLPARARPPRNRGNDPGESSPRGSTTTANAPSTNDTPTDDEPPSCTVDYPRAAQEH